MLTSQLAHCRRRSIKVCRLLLPQETSSLTHSFSGKSSVLEGLTGFAFPRNSGLCTRFCTQIIFRRSPVNQISVSIIAHEDAAKDCKDKMSAWSHNNLPEMTTVRFAETLQEVILPWRALGSKFRFFQNRLIPDQHVPIRCIP